MEKQNVVGWFRNTVKFPAYAMGAALLASTLGGLAMAQGGPLVLERAGRTIALEPYAPNILRVTMSIDRSAATGAPGYGFVAKPSAEGWTHERDAEGYDVFRSARMVVRLAPEDLPKDPQDVEGRKKAWRDLGASAMISAEPCNSRRRASPSGVSRLPVTRPRPMHHSTHSGRNGICDGVSSTYTDSVFKSIISSNGQSFGFVVTDFRPL